MRLQEYSNFTFGLLTMIGTILMAVWVYMFVNITIAIASGSLQVNDALDIILTPFVVLYIVPPYVAYKLIKEYKRRKGISR